MSFWGLPKGFTGSPCAGPVLASRTSTSRPSKRSSASCTAGSFCASFDQALALHLGGRGRRRLRGAAGRARPEPHLRRPARGLAGQLAVLVLVHRGEGAPLGGHLEDQGVASRRAAAPRSGWSSEGRAWAPDHGGRGSRRAPGRAGGRLEAAEPGSRGEPGRSGGRDRSGRRDARRAAGRGRRRARRRRRARARRHAPRPALHPLHELLERHQPAHLHELEQGQLQGDPRVLGPAQVGLGLREHVDHAQQVLLGEGLGQGLEPLALLGHDGVSSALSAGASFTTSSSRKCSSSSRAKLR